jgi:hypothetical protein
MTRHWTDRRHRPVFDDAFVEHGVRVFGVDYLRLPQRDGGELYVTCFGWPWLSHLLPSRWYDNRHYSQSGTRLAGSTGAVYRVSSVGEAGRVMQLVVKFNRFAQDVPVHVGSTLPDHVSMDEAMSAQFNSPFEELGLLGELRRGQFGPPELRIRTKRPLAIYCPPMSGRLWQLGRSRSRFESYRRIHQRDQDEAGSPVDLHLDRLYIVLFAWVRGLNAEQMHTTGALGEDELHALTRRVNGELGAKGFRVIDNKPKHFILRQGRDGRLLRRRGELVYALVDFELLQRTREYVDYLRKNYRTKQVQQPRQRRCSGH